MISVLPHAMNSKNIGSSTNNEIVFNWLYLSDDFIISTKIYIFGFQTFRETQCHQMNQKRSTYLDRLMITFIFRISNCRLHVLNKAAKLMKNNRSGKKKARKSSFLRHLGDLPGCSCV